jgi:hypothetical protein
MLKRNSQMSATTGQHKTHITRIYMGTKNYEKGYEYTRFDFRRLLVEEFWDSELGWWIYGSSRFIEERRMARILEIIF